MSDAAIIKAEYVEWKMVKTRKALQLIFEVALEDQERVMGALGIPLPDRSTHVAIARLDPHALAAQAEPAQIEHANDDLEDEPGKPPRPLSQIAGMLCSIGAFQQFIREESEGWDHRPTSDEAAEWLRANCGIKSRTELNTYAVAAQLFEMIRGQYEAWMRVPA